MSKGNSGNGNVGNGNSGNGANGNIGTTGTTSNTPSEAQGLTQPRVDGMGAVGVASHPIVPQGLKNGVYTRHNLGYPVQQGQTWHDLSPNQRQQWFRNHENAWRKKMNQRAGGLSDLQPSLTFGQG